MLCARSPAMHQSFAAVVTAAALSFAAPAQTTELRGVWVARDGLTSRQKIVQTLDALAAANLNLVCVDVWTRGFTIHPSDVLFAACGQRQDPTYVGRDPLAEFVLEAHLRGIEVEAWFEYGFMFGWSGWYGGPTGVGPVLTANPGWIAVDDTGNSQVSDGAGGFFTWAIHEHPAVRQFLIDLATEVVDRYDVDGIQFDRVRYPSTSFGYDPVTSAAYQAANGGPPPANVNQTQWKRWRADGLIAFHQQLYQAVKARRASVRVTDAPVTMTLAYDSFLQDWPQWLVQGSVDLIYPQVYRTTAATYITSLDQQLNLLSPPLRQKVAPGVRAISGTPTNEVLGMVAANRARNLPGCVFWYAEGLYDDLPALTANYYQQTANVPQRPPGFRPTAVVREENDPTTVATAAFLPSSSTAASGGQSLIALPFASAADHVAYTLPVAETGLYSVLLHVPTGSGLATAAPHTIAHAGGIAVLPVDQSTAAPTGWRDVGTFWFALGQANVEIGAVPGTAVVADAVALLRSRFPSGPMAAFGSGTPGSAGGLRLSMHRQSRIGGAIDVQCNRAPAGALVAIGFGATGTALPVFGGTLLVVPEVLVGDLADAAGRAATSVTVPFAPSLVGATLFAQGLVLDAGAPGGVGLSAAAATTVAGS